MVFKEVLKKLRTENGITQEELAAFLNVTRPTVAGYETKGKEPDFRVLILLSEYFNVSIDYLLTGQNKTFCPLTKHQEKNYDDLRANICEKMNDLSFDNLEKLLEYEELLLLKQSLK